MSSLRITIVGAGIVGLSLARSLAARGAHVTVFEQGDIPNPSGASFDQHRLIRYQYGAAVGYARMVAEAFPAWERLWRELGTRHFRDTGALSISLREGDYADTSRRTLAEAGLPVKTLDARDLAQRFPHLALPSHAIGVLCHPGGPLYAERIMRDLTRLVAARGVTLVPRTRIARIDPDAATVITIDGQRHVADLVYVAAGAWLGGLEGLAIGTVPTMRQVLCYVTPPDQHAQNWARGPALVVVGDAIIYSLPPTDGTGLKFGCSNLLEPAAPGGDFNASSEFGQRVLAEFAPYLDQGNRYQALRHVVGYYVKDATRKFRLHAQGCCRVITNCDGQMFKFGPLIGERLAEAIFTETPLDSLTAWIGGEFAA